MGCTCGGLPAGWMTNNQAASLLVIVATPPMSNFYQPCANIPCSIVWPDSLTLDVQGLKTFFNGFQNPSAQAMLTWDLWSPPCSGSDTVVGCDLCDMSEPTCGVVSPTTGRQLCKWRHVECVNSHRVTGIRLQFRVGYALSYSML